MLSSKGRVVTNAMFGPVARLLVRAGDLVRAGQEVARAGSTGRSTGTHVHFEVWENGRVLNPRQFLADAASRS